MKIVRFLFLVHGIILSTSLMLSSRECRTECAPAPMEREVRADGTGCAVPGRGDGRVCVSGRSMDATESSPRDDAKAGGADPKGDVTKNSNTELEEDEDDDDVDAEEDEDDGDDEIDDVEENVEDDIDDVEENGDDDAESDDD